MQTIENRPLPNITIDTPLQRILKLCKVLIPAIENNEKTLINNNLNFMNVAMRDYDVQRFGSEELPF